MADRDLRRALADRMPPPAAGEVEAALSRVRSAGLSRMTRRRRLTLAVAAPVAVAAATAAVVIAVAWHSSGPTAQPAVSPAPSATSAEASPTGVWYRHISGVVATDSGPLNLGAIWIIRITSTTQGTFDIRSPGSFGPGTLRYDPARHAWSVDVMARYCRGRPGTYAVSHPGSALALTRIDDACAARVAVLDGNLFWPLTNGDQLNG